MRRFVIKFIIIAKRSLKGDARRTNVLVMEKKHGRSTRRNKKKEIEKSEESVHDCREEFCE